MRTFSIGAYKRLRQGRVTARTGDSVVSQIATAAGVTPKRARQLISGLEELGLVRGKRSGPRTFKWIELTEQPLRLDKILSFPEDERAPYVARLLIALDIINVSEALNLASIQDALTIHVDGIQTHSDIDFTAFTMEVEEKLSRYKD